MVNEEGTGRKKLLSKENLAHYCGTNNHLKPCSRDETSLKQFLTMCSAENNGRLKTQIHVPGVYSGVLW